MSWRVAMTATARRVFEGGIAWAAEHDAPGLRIACHKGIAALEAGDGEALVQALVGVGHYGRDPEFRAKTYQTVRALRVGRQRRASQAGAKARRKVKRPDLLARRYAELKAANLPLKVIGQRILEEFGIGLRQAQHYDKLFREHP